MLICEECDYVFPEAECEYKVSVDGLKPKCPHCGGDNTSTAIQCVFCKEYHSVDEYGYVSGICEECAEKDFNIEIFKAYCDTLYNSELEDFFVTTLYGVTIKGESEKLIETLQQKFFDDYLNTDTETQEAMLSSAWKWVRTSDIAEYCKWRLDYDN